MMELQEYFMKRCLDLAIIGLGKVSPNPMVGAVLEYDGRIIGEGYHQFYGGPHAEVSAIANVSNENQALIPKATLYVNLEPCAHFGKTPPCSDLILKSGIKKVVIGMVDPFLQVAGKGIEKLRAHGCEVITGVLEDNCRFLNRRFLTSVEKGRPYILLKWAETSDGYMARKDGSSKWISDEYSRTMVHQWRAQEDAVMVGANTALLDDPKLNVRDWTGRNPVRIVVDWNYSLPDNLNVFDGSLKTFVFYKKSQSTRTIPGVEAKAINEGPDMILEMMTQLIQSDIQSVMIEGGAKLFNQFFKNNLWDEIRVFRAPVCFNEGIKAPDVSYLCRSSSLIFTDDELSIYFNSI